MIAPHPPSEIDRLRALHATGLLDTPPEQSFDDCVRLAAQICNVPISAVSLVDADRQWFKAIVGLSVCQTSRDAAFCAHAILDPQHPLVVPDATLDPRFADNPLVIGEPHIRFYAGVPLVTREGHALGSLCIIDTAPRKLTPAQLDGLVTLSRQVMRELESHRLMVELSEQKAALDHHAIVAIVDTQGAFTYVNDRFCAISKHLRCELLAPQTSALESAHLGHAFFAKAWPSVSLGYVWRGEVAAVAKNGEPYWVQTTVVPMKGPDGNPWQYVAIGTDITERKHAEQKLRQSEHLQRELIDALPAAVYTTDGEGRITFFNRAAVELSGRVPQLGQDSWCVSWRLYNSDGTPLPHDQCPMAQAIREGRAIRDCEAIAERPDGSRVNFIPYPTPLHEADGRIIGWVNMLVDITSRKRDEDMLRLLGSALEQTEESVMITDSDLEAPGPRICFVNAAFTRLTGYNADEAIGQTPRLTHGPLTDPAVGNRLHEALTRGETFRGQTVNYRKDGTAYELEWQVAPIRNPKGVVTNFVAVQRDISARKEAELGLERARQAVLDAAIESARLKSRFLANMSHELRTPLNTINGISATLIEQNLPPQIRNAAAMILQCGESLLENIQTILTHSSLEAGQTVLDAKPFLIESVLLSALRITGDAARRKNIRLNSNLDPRTPSEFIGDPFRLQQVIVNLLANAIKFTDKGFVYVRLRSLPRPGGRHELRFTIADTGIGITPEGLNRLFKPFSQADDSTTRRHEGTGLGLVISKSLIELMGGRISVRSKPGHGSIFRFSILLPAVRGAVPIFARDQHPGLAGKVVHIIEPDRVHRAHLQAMVGSWGMSAVLFSSEAEAALAPPPPADALHIRAITPEGVTASEPSSERTVWICPSGLDSSLSDGYRAVVFYPFSAGEMSAALASLVRESLPASADLPVAPARGKLGERIPLRILSADDTHSNRTSLEFICKHLGYHTDLVENGLEVLKRMEARAYDLILLDVQMPVLDGIATAREINRRYPDPAHRPRLVAITASVHPGDRENCLDAGMDAYLSKPLLPKQLQACIEHLFASGRPAQTVERPALAWINHEHLVASAEGMSPSEARAFMGELRSTAQVDFDNLMDRLAKAASARDANVVGASLHGLKGCALTLGWTLMAERCIEAMHAIRENRFNAWDTLPVELMTLLDQSSEEFERSLLTAFPG